MSWRRRIALAGRRREGGARGLPEGAAADRPRPANALHPRVRARVLSAALRICAELRHPARSARRGGPRRNAGEPRGRLGVRPFGVLRPRRRCLRAAGYRTAAGPERCARRARHHGRVRPRHPVRAPCARAGDHQRRQCEHRNDGARLRDEHSAHGWGAADPRRGAGRPADQHRAEDLVQPGAPEHALPRSRSHRLHRDDHRGRVDGPVHRPRKGNGHDGAGAHGSHRDAVVRHRQDDSLLPHCPRFVGPDRRCVDDPLRSADAGGTGGRCCLRCRCSWPARSRPGCSSRPPRRRSRSHSSWRCSFPSCRRSCCRGSSFPSAACPPPCRS